MLPCTNRVPNDRVASVWDGERTERLGLHGDCHPHCLPARRRRALLVGVLRRRYVPTTGAFLPRPNHSWEAAVFQVRSTWHSTTHTTLGWWWESTAWKPSSACACLASTFGSRRSSSCSSWTWTCCGPWCFLRPFMNKCSVQSADSWCILTHQVSWITRLRMSMAQKRMALEPYKAKKCIFHAIRSVTIRGRVACCVRCVRACYSTDRLLGCG